MSTNPPSTLYSVEVVKSWHSLDNGDVEDWDALIADRYTEWETPMDPANPDVELDDVGPEEFKALGYQWRYITLHDFAQDIATNGFRFPLNGQLSEGTFWLLNGHHRLAAAIYLGLESVPVHVCNMDEDACPNSDGDNCINCCGEEH